MIYDLITLNFLIFINVIFNYFYLDNTRVKSFRQRRILARAVKYYLLVLLFENFLISVEKSLLLHMNYSFPEALFLINVFHTGLHFFASFAFVPCSYCSVSSVIKFTMYNSILRYNFIYSYLLNCYYSVFCLLNIHWLSLMIC